MRLLNVHELKVKEFVDNNLPPYAIFSHTWGDGEVSYQDIQTPEASSMAGYIKIVKCCEIAKQDGLEYVWIDTCCIDKTSSSELSEAINSMFKWYCLASVCYVFLSDVTEKENHDDIESQFRRSRWFMRGWTLQELLAPEIIIFFNSNWIDIILLDADQIQKISIAARMSWAAERETTRVEDIAYSLMGIFNVNMPPLYGEGYKAFQRLQLEIMRYSNDESILAWTHLYDWSDSGLEPLAPFPASFKYCRGVVYNDRSRSTPPFSMTNRGLHIWLPGIRVQYPTGRILFYATLNCEHSDGKGIAIGLCLPEGSREWTRSTGQIYDPEYDIAELIPKYLPRDTVDKPMELYVLQSSRSGTVSRRKGYSKATFHFIQNKSTEAGYCIQYFHIMKRDFPWEEVLSPSPTISLTQCICDSANESFGSSGQFEVAYLIIRSIQDPTIQTVVALGSNRPMFGDEETCYYCRIFPGSEIPPELSRLAQYFKSRSLGEQNNFDDIFPRKKTQFYPGDKIVEHLPDDHAITIRFRTGATTVVPRELSYSLSHKFCVDFHVNIEFRHPCI